MKTTLATLLLSLCFILTAQAADDTFAPEPGFVPLFNGRDLTGWCFREGEKADSAVTASFDEKIMTPDGRYSSTDGVLVVHPRAPRKIQKIFTRQEFPKNFVLRLEFRAEANADSGIYVRGPQLQCRDYLVAGPWKDLKQYRPQQWNEIEIVVQDGIARSTCNSEVLGEPMKLPATGPIGLEADRGRMEYRRIRIKELPLTRNAATTVAGLQGLQPNPLADQLPPTLLAAPSVATEHVPAPAAKTPGLGLSGPGAVHSGRWEKMNERCTASAVRSSLIPNLRPLIPDTQLRDTVVILGGDGNYYLTGSSGDDIWDHNDGVELWRSADLQTWDYVGLVWSFERDATWQKAWRFHHKPVRALWAPELHYIKRLKNYFITLSMPPGGRGILRSTTGRPEGPYVNALADDASLPGDIDASLFEDDDGTVYLVYGGGWIARMKDDLSALAEEPRKPELLHPDMDPRHHAETCPPRRNCADIGREGAYLFRKDGKYYLTAADTYEGRYSSLVAIADSIYGPYDHRHEAVPTGGGTNYFQDKTGRWWCGYFGNDDQAPFRERPALVLVDFAPDGRIHVATNQPGFVLQR